MAAAGGCARRAVLQHLWGEDEPMSISLEVPAVASNSAVTTPSSSSSSSGRAMLLGSLVHEMFQEVCYL